MENYMNLSGQFWILSKYSGFGLTVLNHNLYWIYHTQITLNPVCIAISSLSYEMDWNILTHTSPVLWLTADAEIMRCFTVLQVVIALAWCVKIKATPCLRVIVVLDHTCYLSAWAELQPDTFSTLLNHFFLFLSYSRMLLCATFGCHLWGFRKPGTVSHFGYRDFRLAVCFLQSTNTHWHRMTCFASRQSGVERKKSLPYLPIFICASSMASSDRERGSVCTHIPTSKRKLAEIHQLSQKKARF